MKKLLKTLLRHAGYTCYNDRFAPWGISLKLDLERLGLSTSKAQVILDIGANVGLWSTSAHQIFPSATIHAFEPVPTTFATLCTNVAKMTRVRTHCQGFSSETKNTSMQIYDDSRVNSIEAGKTRIGRLIETITVPCTTLDAWVNGLAIDKVDLIKIDVEGHELHVLNGGASMFRAARAAFLLIEAKSVFASEVSGPGVSLEQLSSYLSPLGYRLVVLYTDFVMLPPEQPFYTNFNALFGSVSSMTLESRNTPTVCVQPVPPISQSNIGQ
jgi:FkbM family methyltransferase